MNKACTLVSCTVLLVLFGLIEIEDIRAQGAWEVIPGFPRIFSRHDDIFFVDASVGWIVNGRGEVYKSMDSGKNWSVVLEGGPFFRSVGFANRDKGWIGGLNEGQLLYETLDGGETWVNITDRIAGPLPTGVCGLSVVDESVAYGVGRFDGPPIFIKTIDGGQTWTSKDLSGIGLGSLIDVHFVDRNNGLIVGGSANDFTGGTVIAATQNGGETWQIRHQTTPAPGVGGEWGWKISFPTELTGYVSVEYPFSNQTNNPAKVLKTVDGGLSWEEILVPGSTDPAGLQGIGFISDLVGWTSGRGTTSVTMDGGVTWQQVDDLDGQINRIRLVNDTLAFAVGRQVYRWSASPTATSIQARTTPAPIFTLEQNYPNPFSPSTTIRYELHRDVHVSMRVLDILGREIRVLIDTYQPAGRHEVVWDGRDSNGRRVSAGAYLYLIDMGEATEMKQMVVLE